MIPSTQNSEPHITQIEIQNEIKTIETKKSTNNSLTSMIYSELLKQEICGKLFTSTNVYKMDIGGANARKEGLNSERKEPVLYPRKYWVQTGAMVEADEPMDYSPDTNLFIVKAFFHTFIMFFCTAAFVIFVLYSDHMRHIFSSITGLLLLTAGGFGVIVILYALDCSSCLRTFPYNYVILIIAVIGSSLFLARFAAYYNLVIIAYALIAVTVTVLIIMLLALTSFDFTKYIIYVIAIGIAYAVLTIILLFASAILEFSMKPVHQVILFILTLLMVAFIVIQLQTILGGKDMSFGEDEYAFGAFFLYVSIFDLVGKIIQIIVCIRNGNGF